MAELSAENIQYIKNEYFKLGEDVRRKIMIVAEQLSEGDEQTLHSAVWYFSQKKNRKELDTTFKDIMNEGLDFGDIQERDNRKKSSVPRKIKINRKKK